MTDMKGIFSRLVLLGGLWFVFVASATAQSYTFTTIVGLAGVSGTADGTNSTARFYRPAGLAVDGAGNIYVADLLNQTIRKIAPAGTNWVVSTLAGLAGTLGSADGTNDQARFDRPSAVAVDNAGNLFVTDNYNQTIRQITPVGTNWVVSTVAGLAGSAGSDDGTNSQARFKGPQAIAVDNDGRLYVTDRLNCTIRQISPVGTNWVVSTLAGVAITLYGGFVDGTNGDAKFNAPFGISRHSGGNLYVADFGNNAIRKISPVGPDWVTTTVAGFSGNTGTNDGPASQAMFSSPNGIAVDASETLYVTDQFNYTIRKIEPAGNSWVVSTVGGVPLAAGTNDGVGASARFYRPWGIALGAAGDLFVADEFNNTIRRGTLLSAPSPALQILLAANQVVLSWPIAASNYVLETTRTLGSEASWMALTNGLVLSGDSYFLTNDLGPGPAFFRLHSQ
jgi:sugar lactone lactonase YvrE